MTDALAWALVHFLWQGVALAAIAWVLMRLTQAPAVRYVIGVATMAAMVGVVGATAATPSAVPVSVVTEPAAGADATASVAEQGPAQISATAIQPFVLPTTWILAAWALGVLLLSVRVFGGWWIARQVAHRAVAPLPDDLQALSEMLALRLGLRRAVRLCSSSRVAVPVMIGWLRPVVLVPPAALAGLSISQIEAILAHEFAHIRRHDYLVNLFQTAVETLLFFHPAVWWLSREIRRDRELCCDDVAVSVCDRLTYATALSALAHLQPPALALAATDGSLRDRVRRIVSTSPTSESAKGGWMAMLPLMFVISLAAPSALAGKPAPVTTGVPVIASPLPQVATTVEPPQQPAPTIVVPTRTRNMTVERAKEVTPEPSQAALEDLRYALAQLDIDRQRLELDRRRAESQARVEESELEAALVRSVSEVRRVRDMVDRGLASFSQLANLETEVKATEVRLAAARTDRELTLQEMAIRLRELALREEAVRRDRQLPSSSRALGMTDTIRQGDRVSIQVAGEDQLPRDFTVDANGAIRYPFLGVIRIEGRTPAQVQEVVVTLLRDRRLSEDPKVTVTVTRR